MFEYKRLDVLEKFLLILGDDFSFSSRRLLRRLDGSHSLNFPLFLAFSMASMSLVCLPLYQFWSANSSSNFSFS